MSVSPTDTSQRFAIALIRLTVDPWFNFRATKYLVEHGFYPFWDWFDDSTYAN
jgi:asparagine N-glycosylation enzyme membrane subunit Stt3